MTESTTEPGTVRPIDRALNVERLRTALDGRGVPAAVIAATPNMAWLTGFGGAGRIVVTSDRLVVITDPRYGDRAASELDAAGVDGDVAIARSAADAIAALVGLCAGADTVGAEGNRVVYDDYRRLADELPLVSISGVVEDLRRLKQPGEIDRMAWAARMAAEALAAVAPGLLGMTEREVAAELDRRMRDLGADGPGYDTIVASGPNNAARPHHAPTHRVVSEGDTVIIDVGAELDGYRSDMTRSFVIGSPSGEQCRWYRAVLEAQAAGREAVRGGATAVAVDRACRDRLADDHLDELLTHGVGHGVGLEIHEPPLIGANSPEELRVGDVVTIEPGVYDDGVGGIRIEDLGVVTETGYEVLTDAPYDLSA